MDIEEGELNARRRGSSKSSRSEVPEKRRKSRFSGKSIYERDQRDDGSSSKGKGADSSSRDRSRSRRDDDRHGSEVKDSSSASVPAPPTAPQPPMAPPAAPQQPAPPAENAPMQSSSSQGAAAEGEAVVIEDPNNVHKQCEKAAAEALKRAMALLRKRGLLPPEEVPEEEKEEEKEEKKEDVPAPVNPLLNKLAEKESGNLSWYKPASETTATALKSILEKV